MKLLLPFTLLALAPLASAVVVGVDNFDYADGSIGGQTGGTGWNYDNFDSAVTASASNWNELDFGGGAQNVLGGALTTAGGGALREYNGPIEGAGDPSNDAQDDHERSGAARGVGQVYYRFDMTRSSGAEWGGASSMDFGAERIFFGVPGADFANDTAGVEISGGGGFALTSISLADGVTNTLVGVLDFDNGLVALFVNPTSGDFWNPLTGNNSADASLAYGGTNWSTGVRLASGGTPGSTAWDNLTVALNDPTDVGLLPEPSVSLLAGLAGLFLLRRRSR